MKCAFSPHFECLFLLPCCQVIATDGGQPRRSTAAIVEVLVTDVNDERPVFESDKYVFSSSEIDQVGTVIGTVRALDRDRDPLHRRVHYNITSVEPADAAGLLRLDPTSGQLTIQRPLDYERARLIRLRVVATDTDSESSMTSGVTSQSQFCDVIVHVSNVNDNRPVFVFPNSLDNVISLSADEMKPGLAVTRLIAVDMDDEDLNTERQQTDPDKTSSPSVTFNIAYSDAASRTFIVDRLTGVVSIGQFEPWTWQMPDPEPNNSGVYVYHILLTVVAADNGRPNLTAIERLDVAVHAKTTASNLSRSALAAPADRRTLFDKYSLLVVVGGAVLGAAAVVVLCVALVCITRVYCRRRRDKSRRVYNCRLNEVDRTTLATMTQVLGPDSSKRHHRRLSGSESHAAKVKKGVTFDLDDADEIGQWRDKPRVTSSPVEHGRECCMVSPNLPRSLLRIFKRNANGGLLRATSSVVKVLALRI